MAGIIQISTASGFDHYAIVRDSTGNVWNGSAFAAFSAASWSTYVIALTEQGQCGYYKASFPPGIIAAGKYSVTIHQEQGDTPDPTDSVVGFGSMYWDGTSELSSFGGLTTLNTDAMPELTSLPPATPTIYQALMFLYMALRNKRTATAGAEAIYRNAGTVVATAPLSDDGTTFTKDKFV